MLSEGNFSVCTQCNGLQRQGAIKIGLFSTQPHTQ